MPGQGGALMAKVQITRWRGLVEGVPQGEEPQVELDLEPGETVLAVELQVRPGSLQEERSDWRWTALIVRTVGDGS
jgi:hypothetical protein